MTESPPAMPENSEQTLCFQLRTLISAQEGRSGATSPHCVKGGVCSSLEQLRRPTPEDNCGRCRDVDPCRRSRRTDHQSKSNRIESILAIGGRGGGLWACGRHGPVGDMGHRGPPRAIMARTRCNYKERLSFFWGQASNRTSLTSKARRPDADETCTPQAGHPGEHSALGTSPFLSCWDVPPPFVF